MLDPSQSHEPARRPALLSGASVSAIVPRSFEDAFRLANVIAASRMVPKSYRDKSDNPIPEMLCVAILHGMEVGFTPMAAIQSIAVVNNMPTIYGDGALALVRASGLMEFIRETTERDAKGALISCTCETKRRGDPESVVRTFSMADATLAGLTSKPGPWKDYPQRMLQMRARAFALRDTYPDVLRGLKVWEEAIDIPHADVTVVTAPAPAQSPARGSSAQLDALAPPRPPVVVPQATPRAEPAAAQTRADDEFGDPPELFEDPPFVDDPPPEDLAERVVDSGPPPLECPADALAKLREGKSMAFWKWLNTAFMVAPPGVRMATAARYADEILLLTTAGDRQAKMVEEWAGKAGVAIGKPAMAEGA